MKRIILAAASIAALSISAPAFAADSQSTAITLAGSVAPTCVMTAPTSSGVTNATFGSAAGNGGTTAVTITNLADAGTAVLNSAGFTLTYSNSFCNYAHSVGIKATNGGLINASAAANAPVGGTFVQRVGYDADVTWAGASTQGPKPASVTTTAAGDGAQDDAINTSVSGSNRGDLVLSVAIDNSATDPVVSGAYSETLTLKIGATL